MGATAGYGKLFPCCRAVAAAAYARAVARGLSRRRDDATAANRSQLRPRWNRRHGRAFRARRPAAWSVACLIQPQRVADELAGSVDNRTAAAVHRHVARARAADAVRGGLHFVLDPRRRAGLRRGDLAGVLRAPEPRRAARRVRRLLREFPRGVLRPGEALGGRCAVRHGNVECERAADPEAAQPGATAEADRLGREDQRPRASDGRRAPSVAGGAERAAAAGDGAPAAVRLFAVRQLGPDPPHLRRWRPLTQRQHVAGGQ
mmetsp:Transcript_46018/g.141729  ORF Transcript_46018/g.141729 Transcript_46018/m.141729 type:complete len:261 (-) Transcript_46018:11-793(-)